MSSDRQDPGAIWQGASPAQWNQPAEQVLAGDEEGPAALPQQQRRGAYYPGTPIPEEAAGEFAEDEDGATNNRSEQALPDEQAAPASTLTELLNHFGSYITFILAPLLFAGLTCLFVLPQVASGHASLPAGGFWPITLVILAIAIAQGAAAYYTSSSNGMWVLVTVVGFCLFLLTGCFALFGLLAGTLLFVALLAAGIVLFRRCIHPVPDGYADIIFVGKKYDRTLYPGFNILFPWEEVAAQLNVAETQWLCPTQIIQLSRNEDVTLRALISYQLLPEDAHLAVTQVSNWEDSLRTLFIATLQTISAVFVPDDFLAWPQGIQARHTYQPADKNDDGFTGGLKRREQINTFLFQSMRDQVATWGVQINWVKIRDVELAPHGMIAMSTGSANPAGDAAPASPNVAAAPVQPPAEPAVKPVAASAQPKQPQAPSVAPAPPAARHVSSPLLKEEFLIKIYKEVQDGHITDPNTIRDFAAKFEQVARDPQASQTVSFDAARAALNLYEQARRYEEQYAKVYENARAD